MYYILYKIINYTEVEMLIIISGRTNSGKDTLVEHIKEKFAYEGVCTHTDRPMRSYEKDGREHYFHTREELDSLLKTMDVLAYTEIIDEEKKRLDPSYHGCRYFTDQKDIKDNSIIILDVSGYEYFKTSGIPHLSIYVSCDESVRRERAIKRGDDIEVFEKRCFDENAQFDKAYISDYDVVVSNNGGIEEMFKPVDMFLRLHGVNCYECCNG